MNALSALSVQNTTKRFGGLVAVNQMSFELRTHEVLGLIGPNGSGKTTMLNVISGALKANSGFVSLFGKVISDQPANLIARSGIARTFQLVRTLNSMNALENVEAGGVFGHRRLWKNSLRSQAIEMLDKVGMAGSMNNPISSLTYIDQKRIELARALMSNPRLLLLDEWLAGLNPSELQIGIDVINNLKSEGHTIIIVEHVMDAIRSLCDRCVVMNTGKKIAEGKPEEVLEDEGVIQAYLGSEHA
ncbi:MAG: ABC transporter ATP-binding protein [Rhodospirillales bacterium]|nr:ABC transporter ATP-binding protein [Rhodospirillales bacterium]